MQKPEFRESDHTYWLNGQQVPNVTTLMEPIVDLSMIPPAILEHKIQIGHAVHLATQFYDDGTLDTTTLDPQITGYVEAWINFKSETGFQHEESEQVVYSQKYGYCGTFDRVGKFDSLKNARKNQRCLIDIKSVYELRASTGVQLAGYTNAYNESHDAAVSRKFAIQLKKDGTYLVQEYNDPMDMMTFISLLTIHNWRQKHAD